MCFFTTPGSGSSFVIPSSCSSSVILSPSAGAQSTSVSSFDTKATLLSSSGTISSHSNFLEYRFTNPLSSTPCKSLGRRTSTVFFPSCKLLVVGSSMPRIRFFLRSNSLRFSSLADLAFVFNSCNFLVPRSRNEHDLRKFPTDSISAVSLFWSSFDRVGSEPTLCNEVFSMSGNSVTGELDGTKLGSPRASLLSSTVDSGS